MRKRGLLPTGVLLFLSASLLAHAPSRFSGKPSGQDQPQRPKFYALQVVCKRNIQNPTESLGAPDGRYAEILAGGQLIVLMEKNFIDSGTVVCKGEVDYGLEGWFRIQETQDERQNYTWIIIQRESCNRFLFFPESYIWWGNTGMNMIRITSVGTKSLFVDAVIGYGMEEVLIEINNDPECKRIQRFSIDEVEKEVAKAIYLKSQ